MDMTFAASSSKGSAELFTDWSRAEKKRCVEIEDPGGTGPKC